MAFNISLGPPSAPFSFPSSPRTLQKARHQGPAEKERGSQRAARHHAAKTYTPPPPAPTIAAVVNPPSVPAPVASASTTVNTTNDSVESPMFYCDI